MKAIVYENYGLPDVLQLDEVEKPVPEEDEILVQVHAASVNYIDWQQLVGKNFLLRLLNGLQKPKHRILGDDVAGRVEAVGGHITQFKAGDEVFGISEFGAFAEYACIEERYLAQKPTNLTFKEAAAVPTAAVSALMGIHNQGKVQAGQKVLINGASGGVGTYAVQIAKSFGAEVTGVCSTGKVDFVHSIGADHVIDYTRQDFADGQLRYDMILAVAGNRPIFDYQRALTPGGTYVFLGGSIKQFFQAMLIGPIISATSSKTMGSLGWVKPGRAEFDHLVQLLENGQIVPVIDKVYPLKEVPEALGYYGAGNTCGKVVIAVAPGI